MYEGDLGDVRSSNVIIDGKLDHKRVRKEYGYGFCERQTARTRMLLPYPS